MGTWWIDQATQLQDSVKLAEMDQKIDYEEEEIRRAIFFTRHH